MAWVSREEGQLILISRSGGLDSRSPGRAATSMADHRAAVPARVRLLFGPVVAGAGAEFRRAGPGRDDTPAGMVPAAAPVIDACHQSPQGHARQPGRLDLVAHPPAVPGSCVRAGPVDHGPVTPRVKHALVLEGGRPGGAFVSGAGAPSAATRGRPDSSCPGHGLGEVGPPGEAHHTGMDGGPGGDGQHRHSLVPCPRASASGRAHWAPQRVQMMEWRLMPPLPSRRAIPSPARCSGRSRWPPRRWP